MRSRWYEMRRKGTLLTGRVKILEATSIEDIVGSLRTPADEDSWEILLENIQHAKSKWDLGLLDDPADTITLNVWCDGRLELCLAPMRLYHDPKLEGCKICGHLGEFRRTALCCPTHGVFGGF